MIFYPKNFDCVIHALKNSSIKSVMFYGPKKGLIDHYISLIKQSLNLTSRMLNYSEISNVCLEEILNSLNIFSNKEILIIMGITGSASKNVMSSLKQTSYNFPIFIAEELTSGMRQFFQKDPNLALIPCYEESAADLQIVIQQYLANQITNKVIEPQALEYLCFNLNSDRRFLYSELDKLIIYCDDKATISLQDVQNSLFPLPALSIDQMIYSFVNKDIALYLANVEYLLNNNISEMLIIRSLVKYYANLYTVKLNISQGIDINSALKLLKPPIFFMHINSFKSALVKENYIYIQNTLKLLTSAEVKLKLPNKNIKNIFEEILLTRLKNEKNLHISYSTLLQ